MQRECATPKGDGKGGKGDFGNTGKGGYGKGHFGKGQTSGQAFNYYSKGGSKGYSDKGQQQQQPAGYKGGGKGYQGTCHNCRKVGHKKWECVAPVRTNAVEGDDDDEQEMMGVWQIGNVEMEETMVHRIAAVKAEVLTRTSAMKFNEAKVRRPLASAVQVAKAGNLVVLDEDGGYIENTQTKERMKVRVEKNTYVFDVQVEGGDSVAVTLDSGAGCSVWPRGWYAGSGSKLLPNTNDVRMVAANGTDIPCYGQRVVKFRGVEM